MGITVTDFGKLEDGRCAKLFTLANGNGMSIEVTDFGATLVGAVVPDREGKHEDVILGYADVTDYTKYGGFLGAVIGRSGNRIGGAEFTINGVKYTLDKNENGNNLHSGKQGYDSVIWEAKVDESALSVVFSHHSPDGDQGYPGNFDVTVTYTLTEENEIRLDYRGVSDKDTIANLTNHSYFNLDGHESGSILEHTLWLNADAITAVDAESIPTGEIRPVDGTPFDFREPKTIGRDIESDDDQIQKGGGYDHNYVLCPGEGVRKIAEVVGPKSGRRMEVFTDCVGVQFYTGNFMDETSISKDGKAYHKRDGFCLETQFFPDAIHHENFASPILKAGEEYHTTTIYKFSW
ncbi:MAG: aldose epimerase family protein [Eubacteriales bacterium]|nr:aldose epimerase family protein [Eubacteriales bacterium]